MTRATARSVSTGNFARLGPGRYATVLRLGGTPVAYRPPADLERMFREVRRRASSFGWGPRPARGNRSPDSRPPPPARRSRAGNRTERARGVSGTGLSPLSPAPGSYGRSRPVRIREGPRGPGSARGAYAGASRTAHRPRPPFQPTAGAWSGRRGAPNGVVLGRTGRVTAAGRTPPVLEFEVVGVAVGAALVSGSLSLLALVPGLAHRCPGGPGSRRLGRPTERSSPGRTRGPPSASRQGFGLGALALGGALFLAGPTPFLSVRGLVLAVSLLPLWAAARNLPSKEPVNVPPSGGDEEGPTVLRTGHRHRAPLLRGSPRKCPSASSDGCCRRPSRSR